MRTTDNNGGQSIEYLSEQNIRDLYSIGNKNLIDLKKDNPDLLIFPQILGKYNDDIEKSSIFSIDEEKLTTNNLMGFIGRNSSQLTISSRFAKDDKNDFFLHYMLQKVFSINILKFDQTTNKENIWDFLLYMFPHFLKKAYSQGLYKTYKKKDYNDANVKGSINIKKHLNKNIPFTGKISYSTREHSFNNNITQLIRHTIEYIKTHPYGIGILTNDIEIRNIIREINFATQNTYKTSFRDRIISDNLRPISHPYFTKYKILQKICLKILKHNKITFGTERDKVYGLLFDGAWLWEEYLNILLKEYFLHPENKTGKNRQYLFEDFQPIYPDFISKSDPKIVADAKYIPLNKQHSYLDNSERAISIYYKTITYMYRFSSNHGILIFPHQEISYFKINKIKNTKGVIKKIGLAIPQNSANLKEFIYLMAQNEKEMMCNLFNMNV
ncbi:restriction endonuclease [Chryseobacterium sp. G0186]|uniref:McrC family protein n=1 Tax=Chryseobacterium sp. G0186 TaxID=2487064 RepID=UPI000F4F1D40|nr:restriction endonuclease [Chryseobacterium sp. G0186]AZA78117.1 restriction endonuclease [Chryseobacterium sp. G0186]